MLKSFKSIKNLEFPIAILLLLIGTTFRFFPHSPNFTPIGAIFLFAGTYFSRKTALLLLIGIMIMSDMFIGFYQASLMVVVYGSFLIYIILGFWLKQHKKWYTILGSSILAAVIFFLLTNLAVWAFSSWYPKTISGLIECYLLAIPFFRNSLLGNLFYVPIFFGTYEIVGVWLRKRFAAKEINPVLSN